MPRWAMPAKAGTARANGRRGGRKRTSPDRSGDESERLRGRTLGARYRRHPRGVQLQLMRSSQLKTVALVGVVALLTACVSTGDPLFGRASSRRAAAALRPVLTATFRPAGGVYGVTTGDGSAWATSGGSLYRIDPVTDRSESVLSLATASLSTLAYGAGSLWVTDDSGILRVDPATGKVTGTIPIVTSA